MTYWKSHSKEVLAAQIKQLKYEDSPTLRELNLQMSIKILDLYHEYNKETYDFVLNMFDLKERQRIFKVSKKFLLAHDPKIDEIEDFNYTKHELAISSNSDLYIEIVKEHKNKLKEELAYIDKSSCFIGKKLNELIDELGPIERLRGRLLSFFIAIELLKSNSRLFRDTWEIRGTLSSSIIIEELTGVPLNIIHECLGHSGLFKKLGLFEKSYSRVGYRISNHFLEYITSTSNTSLMDTFFEIENTDDAFETNCVSEEDFNKIIELTQANKPSATLLSGVAGAGKTSLLKTIAKITGKNLYSIRTVDNSGRDSFSFRKTAVSLAQDILSPDNDMLEISEAGKFLCNSNLSFSNSDEDNGTDFFKVLMDKNKIQMYFTTNIEPKEDSVKRRFNLAIRFSDYNTEQRKLALQNIIKQKNINFIKNDNVEKISQKYPLNPGSYFIAIETALNIGGSEQNKLENFHYFLNNQSELLGVKLNTLNQKKLSYKGINTNICLDTVERHLFAFNKARKTDELNGNMPSNFCINGFGPSGVGKSESFKIMANRLGLELQTITPSLIKNKYVGESEKKLRSFLTEATEYGKAVLLDEFDTIGKNKDFEGPEHVNSLTNELLTLMSELKGLVLFATTNYPEQIETSLNRRFLYKIKYSHLKDVDKVYFFNQFFPKNHLEKDDILKLKHIPNISVGDFVNVYNQVVFERKTTSSEILSKLKNECSYKTNFQNRISL